MSEWLRNPDVAWEIVDDPAPGVIASGGRASSGGGGGGGGITTDANLQALGNRLQWRIAPAMASVPSEANKRAIGFDDSGTLIIWLEGDTKRVAIHGGGAANSEGTTTTAGKVFLTFGDGTISGDASRHSQIKLDDGVMVNASLKFDKSVNSVPHNEDRGIGYSTAGDAFIKTQATDKKLHYQAGGRSMFEANGRGIRLPFDASVIAGSFVRDPGDFTRRGDDVFVHSGGMPRNLSDLPAAPGSKLGTQVPVLINLSVPTAAQLDAAFGSIVGSVGLHSTRSTGTSVRGNYRLWVKALNGDWKGIIPTAVVSGGTRGADTYEAITTFRRVRMLSESGNVPTRVVPAPRLGEPMFFASSATPSPPAVAHNRFIVGDGSRHVVYTTFASTTVSSTVGAGHETLLLGLNFVDLEADYNNTDLGAALGRANGTLGWGTIVRAGQTTLYRLIGRIATRWLTWTMVQVPVTNV